MAAKRDLIVVSYDIEDDKNRKKISDALLDAGGIRVQKSVFECFLKKSMFDKLEKRIHKLRSKNDSIRYYFICKTCMGRIVVDENIQQNPAVKESKVCVI